MGKTHRDERTVIISPKLFLSKPFTVCPNCNRNNSYGVSNIGNNRYTKRCCDCGHSESYNLPPLDKQVIYIDQFVLSNIAKALNKDLGRGKKIDTWYTQLFAILDTLSKSQLIVCPDSEFHRQESLSYSFKSLKRLYEQLSFGTTLYDSSTIARFQIDNDFKRYIGTPTNIQPITCDDVLMGDRNDWQDRLLITIESKIDIEEIKYYQQYRNQISDSSKQFFNYWSKQKNIKYKDLFTRVATEYGNNIVHKYLGSAMKYLANSYGKYTLTESDVISLVMSEESVLITNLLNYLPEDQPYETKVNRVMTYLQSDDLHKVPFNKIKSSLWAAIEYQIMTGGRLTPPNVGMTNDINMVGSYLPYVDAMFVDNDMRSLLQFGPVKQIASGYKAKVFSPSNKDEFFAFLSNIEKNSPVEIKEKVLEVYGDEYIKPYYEIYENQ